LYDYDWKEAGEQFRLTMAAEHVPAEVRARCSLNYLLPMGRMQEAIVQIERALEQDPLNINARATFALVLSLGEAYDRAIAEGQKAVEMDASHWMPHFTIGLSYAMRGEFAAARPAAERSVQAVPWFAPALGLLAGILARLDEKERADELVAKLRNMAHIGLLLYHILFSENDTTVDWFAKMIEDRDPLAPPWSRLKLIRSSPRWPALAKMMNLPPEAL
jgi:tetratricopeptide (TPR) repeat protein